MFRNRWILLACAAFAIAVLLRLLDSDGSEWFEEAGFFARFVGILCVLLAGGFLGGIAAKRIGFPAIVGELSAGILLGLVVVKAFGIEIIPSHEPYLMGHIDVVLELAIFFLLLDAGMEVDLGSVLERGRDVVIAGVVSVLVPIGGIHLFVSVFGGFEWVEGIFILYPGVPLVVSTTVVASVVALGAMVVAARALRETRILGTEIAGFVLGMLAVNEIICWALASVMLSLHHHGDFSMVMLARLVVDTALFLTVSLLFLPRIVDSAIRFLNERLGSDGVAMGVFFLALSMSYVVELLGLSKILGVFVAGMIAGSSEELTESLRGKICFVGYAFFVPMYFVALALGVDLVEAFDLWLLLLVVVGCTLLRLVAYMASSFIVNVRRDDGLVISTVAFPIGAASIILAEEAMKVGMVSEELFVAFVIAMVVTNAGQKRILVSLFERAPPPLRNFGDVFLTEEFDPAFPRMDRRKFRDAISERIKKIVPTADEAVIRTEVRENMRESTQWRRREGILVLSVHLPQLRQPRAFLLLASRGGLDLQAWDGFISVVMVAMYPPDYPWFSSAAFKAELHETIRAVKMDLLSATDGEEAKEILWKKLEERIRRGEIVKDADAVNE